MKQSRVKLKQKKEAVYAFIDSQNLNLGIRHSGWTLDFKKFRFHLGRKYNVTKTFLFIGYVPGNERLYSSLQDFGYKLIFKPTLQFKKKEKTKIKGNVDAELVLHSMIELPNYSKAIIVSGDGDFHCLIDFLDSKKKLLNVLVPNRHYSALLRNFAKYIILIENIKSKVRLKK